MKDFIKKLLDKDSSVSSKRFIAITLIGWAITMGTYYIVSIQLLDGVESSTTANLLEFTIVSGVGLLAGGTAAEALKRKE